jgi:TRAP-type C4-dicarboxylate transport system substrate-binding protein
MRRTRCSGRAQRRGLCFLLVALLLPVGLAACFGGGGKAGGQGATHALVLTMANHEGGEQDLVEYVRAVERLSGGSMRIELRSNWRQKEIDYDRGTLADVRTGKVDLAKIGLRSFDTLGVDSFQPVMAPLLVDSTALEGKVLASPLAGTMLARVQRLGVAGVAMLPGELRRPFGISRRLLGPSDYKGATIGIRPSLVSRWTFEALGAAARPYTPGRLPLSFDGAELDVSTAQGNSYDSPGTFLTGNVALWPRAFAVIANKSVLARFTPDQQEILREAGREALAPALDRLRRADHETTGILCRAGQLGFLTASGDQLASLRSAVRPVYTRIERDPEARTELATIERMKRDTPPEPLRKCATEATGGTDEPTPLEGVYEADTSKADLLATRATDIDITPENWGHWVYVFAGNRLAYTQEDAESCTWAYGDVSVQGDSFTWRILDGGYTRAPNLAYNKPGELFRYRWSRYRDTLTLFPVPGSVSAENFRAKPWHLVSTTPTRSYFSTDCPPPAEALD